jgi:hypothetical protein
MRRDERGAHSKRVGPEKSMEQASKERVYEVDEFIEIAITNAYLPRCLPTLGVR